MKTSLNLCFQEVLYCTPTSLYWGGGGGVGSNSDFQKNIEFNYLPMFLKRFTPIPLVKNTTTDLKHWHEVIKKYYLRTFHSEKEDWKVHMKAGWNLSWQSDPTRLGGLAQLHMNSPLESIANFWNNRLQLLDSISGARFMLLIYNIYP